jgi:hypothetical protein
MRNGANVFEISNVIYTNYLKIELNYVEDILRDMKVNSRHRKTNIYLIKVLMAYNIDVLKILSNLIGNEYISGLLSDQDKNHDCLIKIFQNYLSKKYSPMRDIDKYLLSDANTDDIELIIYILNNYITPGKYIIKNKKGKFIFKRIGDLENQTKNACVDENKFIQNISPKKKYSKESKKIRKEIHKQQKRQQQQQQRIQK